MLSTPITRENLCRPSDATALLPAAGIFRILICRPTHSLGNTLLLTPLLRDLQAIYPGAEIDIVARTPVAAQIFERFSNVRHVICLPSRAFQRPTEFIGALSRMRQSRYDLVIDPHPHSRTGRALLYLSRGTYKLGFSGYKDSLLTHAVPVPQSTRHTGHRPVFLLRSALGHGVSAAPTLDIALSSDERSEGQETLRRLLGSAGMRSANGVIGVFANATGSKLLSESWWQSLLSAVAARYSAHAIVEIVPAFGRSMLGSRYPTFYSSDVRRLAGVLSQLSLFVSGDCGVMHLACASGAPVAGVFSATDPVEWGPYGPRDFAIDVRGLTAEQVAKQLAEQIALPDC